jgi:bifunctional non-homologous end joining protein LigD
MMLPRKQPIIPVAVKQPFDDPEWIFEFKYDGFRALYYVENGRSWFLSRNGNHLTRFDDLSGRLIRELDVSNAVLDGEVIAADETRRPQFYDLLRRTRKPSYVAFDLLWLDDTDLRSLPLDERRARPARCRASLQSPSSRGRYDRPVQAPLFAIGVGTTGRCAYEPESNTGSASCSHKSA